jgi:hypothetical protein
MYILALKNVQLNLDANAYTQVRKLIDVSMRSNFKYVIYAAMLGNLLLVVSTVKSPASVLFIAATVAFVALVVDTLLTVKGNLPINNIINSWEPGSAPTNWADYRAKWFAIFQYRQVSNIIGFLSLLVGAVFGRIF